tara:strand:- start:272 stop:625 length:354 start_codon:yes stop_codon:yes gene_type:complete
MFTLKGKLIVKGEEKQITEKFKKREFVIQDDSEQYPQVISFQLVQDKCSLLETYNEGDVISVNFNVRGREWVSPKDGETKYFNSLEAWKLSGENDAPTQIPTAVSNTNTGEEDDLPF